jgi:hypothetical protein
MAKIVSDRALAARLVVFAADLKDVSGESSPSMSAKPPDVETDS